MTAVTASRARTLLHAVDTVEATGTTASAEADPPRDHSQPQVAEHTRGGPRA